VEDWDPGSTDGRGGRRARVGGRINGVGTPKLGRAGQRQCSATRPHEVALGRRGRAVTSSMSGHGATLGGSCSIVARSGESRVVRVSRGYAADVEWSCWAAQWA
jgi:hypothetical protein